jgi:hypothetical protein
MGIGRTWHVVAFAIGLFTWSVAAYAQQPGKVPRVGILSDETPSQAAKSFEPAFARGLLDLGWMEGQNIAFERHYAAGKLEAFAGSRLIWSAPSPTSSSPSGLRRRRRPSRQRRRSRSSLPASAIRSESASFPRWRGRAGISPG